MSGKNWSRKAERHLWSQHLKIWYDVSYKRGTCEWIWRWDGRTRFMGNSSVDHPISRQVDFTWQLYHGADAWYGDSTMDIEERCAMAILSQLYDCDQRLRTRGLKSRVNQDHKIRVKTGIRVKQEACASRAACGDTRGNTSTHATSSTHIRHSRSYRTRQSPSYLPLRVLYHDKPRRTNQTRYQ